MAIAGPGNSYGTKFRVYLAHGTLVGSMLVMSEEEQLRMVCQEGLDKVVLSWTY